MTRAIFLAVPWMFVLALSMVLITLIWPRIVWPSIGAVVVIILVAVFVGPYLVAAVTYSADILHGRRLDDPNDG